MPTTLFTVNRRVTGDHLSSAMNTLRLQANFKVETGGSPLLNQWSEAMARLFWPQIEALLIQRDLALQYHAKRRGRPGVLDDAHVEVLSIVPIDIDTEISLLAP